ncbi:MAG: endonuclease/exonuclease/phosphatase family protein [Myxococcota bacterium]
MKRNTVRWAACAVFFYVGSAEAFFFGGPQLRFASFNASLNRSASGQLIEDLSSPDNEQARAVAQIIQIVRPDVLLINEFDFDEHGVAARLFQENYLSIEQNGAAPIEYPFVYAVPSNTGVASGFDFDNDGEVGGGNDAFGFGFFEGQFAFVIYSKYPIDHRRIRTFQFFRWVDMPGARLPDDPTTPEPADWYSPEELDVFRLSSKNHVDVPIRVGFRTVHFLCSHPTPPVFDGPEDRNGLRNADEIRFWSDYVTPGQGSYIIDDRGRRGGLRGRHFVIAGDQNSDPFDGDSVPGAAQQLLENRRVNDAFRPDSIGGAEQAFLQGLDNDEHLGNPAFDTADFGETPFGPGNLRVDYVLPSRSVDLLGGGVFWPRSSDPLFELVGVFPFPTSDHRLVYIDVEL